MVTLRPIRPADLGAFRGLMSRLSDADRYLRFLHAVKDVPEPELRHFVELEPSALGLVAEAAGRLVGAAHAFDQGDGIYELAVVVDPAERRHGIAGLLLDRIVEELRSRRADALVAHALTINTEFARMAREHGLEATGSIAGVTQWYLPLTTT